MNRTKHRLLLLLTCAAALAAAAHAHAALTFQLEQVGDDVVLTGSGSLNVSVLTLDGQAAVGSGLNPHFGVAQVGTIEDFGNLVDTYLGATGPSSFGNDTDLNFKFADSGTGDAAGISGAGLGNGTEIRLPAGYVSGDPLFGTATFDGATFASLGFTPGTYTYTWGSGLNADSLTVTSVVPEPSTWALMTVGAGLLAFSVARRRYAQAT